MMPPIFQIVSDRRGLSDSSPRSPPAGPSTNRLQGGRTAWSSRVTVQGKTLSARYWYDGKNLNNAKEDAAECAVNWLSGSASASSAGSNAWPGW